MKFDHAAEDLTDALGIDKDVLLLMALTFFKYILTHHKKDIDIAPQSVAFEFMVLYWDPFMKENPDYFNGHEVNDNILLTLFVHMNLNMTVYNYVAEFNENDRDYSAHKEFSLSRINYSIERLKKTVTFDPKDYGLSV